MLHPVKPNCHQGNIHILLSNGHLHICIILKMTLMLLKNLLIVIMMATAMRSYSQPPVISIDWKKNFGGTEFESPQKIQPTSDGGYIIAGITFSSDGNITNNKGVCDVWLVKLSANGALQWQRTYGGSNDDGAYSVQQTNDGGFIIAGYTKSNNGDVTGFHGNIDCWIVKTDANGTLQWQKALGGSGSEVANSIKQTADGGFVFVGYTLSEDGDISLKRDSTHYQDFWLVKLDQWGNKLWDRCYGGLHHDFPMDIVVTPDNGFAIAGYTQQMGFDVTGHKGKRDMWVIKTNNTGVLQWQKCIGGTEHDIANSILSTADGLIVAGQSSSADNDIINNKGTLDAVLVKLDHAGALKWVKNYGSSKLDVFKQVLATDGGFIAVGTVEAKDQDVSDHYGVSDFWLVKVKGNGTIEWQKNFGGSHIDDALAVCKAGGNDFVIAGTTFSADNDVENSIGGGDFWILKTRIQKLLPEIVHQPADTSTLCEGTVLHFTITANNADAYRWQGYINGAWKDINDGASYNGTSSAVLGILNAGTDPARMFRCLVSNIHGTVQSSVGMMMVNTAPSINLHPAGINTCTGMDVMIRSAATSSIAVQYQWQRSGNNVSWVDIPAANKNSLAFGTEKTASITFYRMIAENACGSDTSGSSKITVIDCSIPNAFSPNGDNINDNWVLKLPASFRLQLFNRHGAMLYDKEHMSSSSWNGMFRNKILPVGAYYYVITMDGFKPFTGSLALLR